MDTRTTDALGGTWTLSLSSSVKDDDILRHGMPADLATITDVVLDLNPTHLRGDDAPRITLNSVEYGGTLYLRSRTYIVSDLVGGNRWYTREHMLDTGSFYRDGEVWSGGPTDAARKKLATSPLVDAARDFLADADAVRAYWAGHFDRMVGYRVADAARELEQANRFAALAREHGSITPDYTVEAI